ncbi:MAG TPA: DinB family protein [Pyrinomonadaceae bacterium]|jgi:uncharacterized damage-inducible protein DinB|nr:DinB family protein [Pyrinomonadaceae bacterium]
MSEIERILDQLKRAYISEAWHGPAVSEILKGITAQQAATRPLPEGHSIWELVLHITVWLQACRRRLKGDPAQLDTAGDWPKVINTGDQSWNEAKRTMTQAYVELMSAIVLLDESKLDQPIIAGMSSNYVTLHGVIQHTLYHAGQIALLKKAISER